jgi:hypothetical protein
VWWKRYCESWGDWLDALADLGIAQLNTPLTPQKVWKAIQEAKAAK